MRGREGIKKRTQMAHGWSHCWKLENQWKKRMMVWCEKVRQSLGQGLCLFLRKTETERVQVIDLEMEWKGNQRLEWIALPVSWLQ